MVKNNLNQLTSWCRCRCKCRGWCRCRCRWLDSSDGLAVTACGCLGSCHSRNCRSAGLPTRLTASPGSRLRGGWRCRGSFGGCPWPGPVSGRVASNPFGRSRQSCQNTFNLLCVAVDARQTRVSGPPVEPSRAGDIHLVASVTRVVLRVLLVYGLSRINKCAHWARSENSTCIKGRVLQSCTPLSFLSYLHGPTAALPCTILAIIDSYPYHWLMDLRLRCLVPISAMPLTPSPFLDISVSLTVYEPALNHHSHSYISSSITMLFFTLILLGFTWNLVASLRLRNLRVWTDFYLRALLVDSLNPWTSLFWE
jgi:hypothetical protein